jgi:cell division protein FtsB
VSAVPAPRAPRAAPRRHLRLVAATRRSRRALLVFAFVAIAVAAIFATVALNALAAGDAVTARVLERDVATAERRHAQLVARVGRLEDPARIERVATEDLGMVAPGGTGFIVLDRSLPGDGAPPTQVANGDQPDPLKPVVSAQR